MTASIAGTVLVCEDEADLAFLLRQNFAAAGFQVTTCGDLAEARAALGRGRFDVLLLDVGLPDGSGFDLLRELRARSDWTPAVFLTARADEADRLMGFAVGGDDYVCKPFSMAELVARLRAIARRGREPSGAQTYACPSFRVELDRFLLVRDGREVPLTFMEAELLRFLISRAGQTVGRHELLAKVWGYDSDTSTRTLDTHVLNLRKKLEADPAQPRHVVTVHGIGYRFVP